MKYVVGIDEVGRGSLAGPVTVAAVFVRRGASLANRKLGKLKDSKKLTPKKREKWFGYFRDNRYIQYSLARVYPRTIEKINISQAANTAALRAFSRLAADLNVKPQKCRIFLDGGLFLGVRGGVKNARTVVRGDEKIKAIAAASIVAKVSRDRAMVRLSKKYPQYGFEIHKGYGTKKHRQAIKKYGPSEVHRLTFLKKYHKI